MQNSSAYILANAVGSLILESLEMVFRTYNVWGKFCMCICAVAANLGICDIDIPDIYVHYWQMKWLCMSFNFERHGFGWYVKSMSSRWKAFNCKVNTTFQCMNCIKGVFDVARLLGKENVECRYIWFTLKIIKKGIIKLVKYLNYLLTITSYTEVTAIYQMPQGSTYDEPNWWYV